MNYQRNNNSFNKVTQSVADLVLAAKAAKIPQGLRELQLTQLYPQDELCPSEEQNLILLQIFGQVYL